MSKYMPRKVVEKELFMQNIRRQHGLKSGHYSLYPDKEKGPYIVLTHKVPELDALRAASALKDSLQQNRSKV